MVDKTLDWHLLWRGTKTGHTDRSIHLF